jgi:hypothetical protein
MEALSYEFFWQKIIMKKEITKEGRKYIEGNLKFL